MPDKEDISAATSPGEHGPRTVRAPRGTALSCKGWQQEAALRMLMNNLDPDVAERPQDLVVYGGSGRAARSWAAFDAIDNNANYAVYVLPRSRDLVSLEPKEQVLHQPEKPAEASLSRFGAL